MRRRIWLRTATATTCCLLVTSLALAQQSTQDNDRQQKQSDRQQQRADQPELPQALQQLDLTTDQQQQIKQAIKQNSQKLRQTWRKFQAAHAQAIELEAAWIAAVRDTLSEQDQRSFDQQRMQESELSKNSYHSESDDNSDSQSAEADTQSRSTDRNSADDRNDRPQSKEQSDDSSRKNQKQEKSNRRDQQTAARNGQDQESDRQSQGRPVGFVVVTLTSPEQFVQGANQSSEQKQQCTQACREYKQEITSVWQKIHSLHHELVSLEADRMQSIEQHLTEEQLEKLKETRQQPSDQTVSTSNSRRNR